MKYPSYMLAIAFAVAVPSTAAAQSAPALSGLYACEAILNKDAQLTCFLTETAKLRGAAPSEISGPVPPVVQPVQPAVTAAPTAPEFAPLEKKKAKAPKKRTVAITRTATNANGMIRFTLENGEVWQQVEKARIRLGQEEPDMLTLRRKSFGSFLGNVNGKRPSFRVRRVQ